MNIFLVDGESESSQLFETAPLEEFVPNHAALFLAEKITLFMKRRVNTRTVGVCFFL